MINFSIKKSNRGKDPRSPNVKISYCDPEMKDKATSVKKSTVLLISDLLPGFGDCVTAAIFARNVIVNALVEWHEVNILDTWGRRNYDLTTFEGRQKLAAQAGYEIKHRNQKQLVAFGDVAFKITEQESLPNILKIYVVLLYFKS